MHYLATRNACALLGAVLLFLPAGCEDSETPEPTTTTFADLDYVPRRFFCLVDPVDPLLTGTLLPLDQGGTQPPVITDMQVWRDNRNQSDNGPTVPGVAYLDPRSGAAAPIDSITDLSFDALRETADYTIRNDFFVVDGVSYPILDMLSPIGSAEVLGATFTATYTLPGGGTDVVRYGATIGNPPSRIVVKALYIPDGAYRLHCGDFYCRIDFWYPMRRLELRNIYRLGLEQSAFTSIEVSVSQAALGNTTFPGTGPDVTYLRGLGVDKTGGQSGFDHHIDSEFMREDLDLLILPDLRPFAPAAEDSVWPFFVRDLPDGRPDLFVGKDANANPEGQSFYDKRPGQINQSEDIRYLFTVTASRD